MMLRTAKVALAGGAALALAIACSSSASKYPACEQDLQCAVNGRHDYCLDGRCVYCRTGADCGERERCRVGKCETDPDAPLPKLDAGGDGDADTDDDDSGSPAAPTEEEDDDGERLRSRSGSSRTPSRVIPRGVRRFLHP